MAHTKDDLRSWNSCTLIDLYDYIWAARFSEDSSFYSGLQQICGEILHERYPLDKKFQKYGPKAASVIEFPAAQSSPELADYVNTKTPIPVKESLLSPETREYFEARLQEVTAISEYLHIGLAENGFIRQRELNRFLEDRIERLRRILEK